MRLVSFHDDVAASNPPGIQELPASELEQPDEHDRVRVRRLLRNRKRYRYVHPKVRTVSGGLRIESPCCSRNLDRSGGVVDIAFLQHLRAGAWRLYRMDHAAALWRLHGDYEQLTDLMHVLNEDPERLFWQ
jgi:hypothetical protein